MKVPGSIFTAVLLGGALLAGVPHEVSAKCANYTVPEFILMINREIVGVYPQVGPNPDFQAAMDELEPADIWLISIGCHEERHPETGDIVRRQAIYVNTIDDVANQGEAWLREIAEAQSAHRREVGTLAMNLTDLLPRLSYRLRYYIQPASAPAPSHQFRMTTSETGWSATFRVEEKGVACYVIGGQIEPPVPGLADGIPQCVVSGEPVAQVAPSAPLRVRIS